MFQSWSPLQLIKESGFWIHLLKWFVFCLKCQHQPITFFLSCLSAVKSLEVRWQSICVRLKEAMLLSFSSLSIYPCSIAQNGKNQINSIFYAQRYYKYYPFPWCIFSDMNAFDLASHMVPYRVSSPFISTASYFCEEKNDEIIHGLLYS